MAETYERGKQQILYNYLPGRVFDFGNTASFAIVRAVEGDRFDEVNKSVIINKIKEQVRAWREDYRPGFENRVFNELKTFSIIDPKRVKADLYPLVFMCENNDCNHIVDYTRQGGPPNDSTCPVCKKKKLVQFRFIRAHQCGHIEPLRPPKCEKCHSSSHISVRGLLQFEKFGDFQWYCNTCNSDVKLPLTFCPNCKWPDNETGKKWLSVILFRANRQFYIHSATLINIPKNDFEALLNSNHWYIIAGAKFIGIPAIQGQTLKAISKGIGKKGNKDQMLDIQDTVDLLKRVKELQKQGKSVDEAISEVEGDAKKMAEKPEPSVEQYKAELIKMSGIEESFWKESQFAMLDSIIPEEISQKPTLKKSSGKELECNAIDAMGIQDIRLIDDFPIVTASFGYSRLSYRANEAWLRTFDAEGEHQGKIPIYVDTVEADALFFQLDYNRVIRWLRANGMNPVIPNGSDPESSIKGYFVKLFSNVDTFRTVGDDNREAKYVLALLHTLSHLGIRRAELLCGLERTSISEYLIPSALSFAMYCNHRFGATIGALTSLYEQALLEWLNQIYDRRKCVYDPVCHGKMGNCHACTHLPETSCRHFNLNLGRVYLFGGEDNNTNEKIIGYFEANY